MRLAGLHHVTVLVSDLEASARFYSGLLGLATHAAEIERGSGRALAFGDELGRPGSMLVAVERGGARGQPASGFVHLVRWRVADRDALEFWRRRLRTAGVVPLARDGRDPAVGFADPDGLAHQLVVDRSADPPLLARAPRISQTVALRGIDGLRAYARDPVPTADLLAGRLEFETGARSSLTMRGAERTASYALDAPPRRIARAGPGTVDHVAWSCARDDLPAWRQRVIGMGARVTPIRAAGELDSFEFREPSGVRFKVAAPLAATAPQPLVPLVRRGRVAAPQPA